MYKIIRGEAPEVLKKKAKLWTKQLLEKRKRNFSYFIWHQYRGKPLNQILQKDLLAMTKDHCAFCDGLFEQSPITIEHFRPKSKFPELAYEWSNLFPCCVKCQQKFDDFDELLLKPDEVDYEFDRYFVFNFANYKIQPNPGASEHDIERAKITIKLFQLDDVRRCKGIERSYKFFKMSDDPDIDDYPYRYFLAYALVL